MKKRIVSLLLVLALCVGLLPVVALAAQGVTYLDENGVSRICTDYTEVTNTMSHEWGSGWYVVKHDVTLNAVIEPSGYYDYITDTYYDADIRLILCDGATLTIGGVCGSGAVGDLTVYGQENGTGKLKATGKGNHMSTAARGIYLSRLTLNGGQIEVKTDNLSATSEQKLTSSLALECFYLTVNGGKLTALGGGFSGDSSGFADNTQLFSYGINVRSKAVIRGGIVEATGSDLTASQNVQWVGSTGFLAERMLQVSGGSLTATGGNVSTNYNGSGYITAESRGISVSDYEAVVQISGGTVKAVGQDVSATRNPGITPDDAESYGMWLLGSLELSGGTLETSCKQPTYNGSASGIQVEYYGLYSVTKTTVSAGTLTGTVYNSDDAGFYLTGGSVGEVTSSSSADVLLSGGTLQKINAKPGGTLDELLAVGCAYYQDDQIKPCGGLTVLENVSVKPHTCRFTQQGGKYVCSCGRSFDNDPVLYLDQNGTQRFCGKYTVVTDGMIDWGENAQETVLWFVVKDNVTVSEQVAIYEDAHLILCDGKTLTAQKGIDASDLTIYAQSTGEQAGKLIATGNKTMAASYGIYSSTLTVNGGVIEATGGERDAMYGCNNSCGIKCKKLIVNNGILTAKGGYSPTACTSSSYLMDFSVGIRVEDDEPVVIINGGKVTATGGDYGSEYAGTTACSYGIEVMADDEMASMTVNGGELKATGGKIDGTATSSAYSIGVIVQANEEERAELTVNGGTVIATSGDINEAISESYSYGLNVYSQEDSVYLMIQDGTLTATSGQAVESFGASIEAYYSGRVSISGGHVTLESSKQQTGLALRFYDIGDHETGYGTVRLSSYPAYLWRTDKTGSFTASSTAGYDYDYDIYIEIKPDTTGGSSDEPSDDPGTDEPDADEHLAWLTPVIGALNGGAFTDVKPGDWFYDAVRYVNEYGLMTGTASNQFSPNAPVTRGMVMTILARREGIKTNRYSPWYAAGVEWAKSVGISDGTNPEAPITREQLAVMLYRYAQYKGYDMNQLAELAFTDAAEISDYATIGLRWAVGAGLMSGAAGLDAGKLLPQSTATRAQLATMLHRFFG